MIPVFTALLLNYFSLSNTWSSPILHIQVLSHRNIHAMALAFFDVFNAICNIFIPFYVAATSLI